MRPLLFRFFAPNFSIIMGGLPPPPPKGAAVPPPPTPLRLQLNPHFYHEMREATLLVMLAMLAGHAGGVENDADDVDGRVKYVHFARDAVNCSILVARTENKKIQNKTKIPN